MSCSHFIGASLAMQLLTACSSSSVAEPPRPTTFRCAQGRLLEVHPGEEHADVDFAGQHYELARRSSGIGLKYASSEATLIIDGNTAVFVNHKHADLQTCSAVAG